jgi:protein involved in polysaccharide export with SLBB domain
VPNSGDPAPRPAANAAELAQVYRVGIGDVLDIRLRRAPTDQSTLFTVTSHGMLEHPILARPFKVLGLTTDEISGRIGAVLKSRAVDENPEVMVGVREYVSHTILVSGLVKDPGTKVLRREAIPLYVVLADAQPVPEGGRAAIIARETGEVTIVELADAKAMNVLVRPGDVINVQANPQWFFYIGGEVRAPGEKSFHPGITLTQAILIAGGLTRKSNEIQLAREGANKLLELRRYKLNEINSGKLPDPLIQPGDRITVPH